MVIVAENTRLMSCLLGLRRAPGPGLEETVQHAFTTFLPRAVHDYGYAMISAHLFHARSSSKVARRPGRVTLIDFRRQAAAASLFVATRVAGCPCASEPTLTLRTRDGSLGRLARPF